MVEQVMVVNVFMKPAVKALLDLDPMQRGEWWLERLAAATFDVEDYCDITPEQRRATKTLYYAYIYGATSNLLIVKYQEAVVNDRMIQALARLGLEFRATVDAFIGATPHIVDFKTVLDKCRIEEPCDPKKDKRVRVSSKTGATWPKPKGSY